MSEIPELTEEFIQNEIKKREEKGVTLEEAFQITVEFLKYAQAKNKKLEQANKVLVEALEDYIHDRINWAEALMGIEKAKEIMES